MVAYVCSPSTWEAEIGGLMFIWGQPGLHIEFETNPSYRMGYIFRKLKEKWNLKRKRFFFCLFGVFETVLGLGI